MKQMCSKIYMTIEFFCVTFWTLDTKQYAKIFINVCLSSYVKFNNPWSALTTSEKIPLKCILPASSSSTMDMGIHCRGGTSRLAQKVNFIVHSFLTSTNSHEQTHSLNMFIYLYL